MVLTDNVGMGACGKEIGRDGGNGVLYGYGVGFLEIGQAEEELEVLGYESAKGIVFVKTTGTDGQGLAQGVIGIIHPTIVDDVGNELEGQGGVYAVATALAETAYPAEKTCYDVVFVGVCHDR